ncbi:unnamed protein product [Chilo suppressalis]|uniref:E3 ubiquitin-protein ligase n=1 Tax=Chilo suppressalis TaxID=168631 RepID=A0ABN8B1F7_CHISP|nr:unnamed protein product [Chilo suppressalis]
MGSEQSTSRRSRENLTKDDVKNLFDEQKRQYILRLKAQQMKDQQKAEQAAREAVQRAMEKMRQEKVIEESTSKLNQSAGQQPATASREAVPREMERTRQENVINESTSKLNQSTGQQPAIATCLQREPRPYSFSQNDIHIGIAQPTRTCIYGNLETASSSGIPATTPRQQSPLTTLGNPPTGPFGIPDATNSYQSTIRTPESSNFVPQRPANEKDELNCPTCKQSYTVAIYQCFKGHSSCSNCKSRRFPCGICGCPIGDMRNISLESFIAESKVACPNSNDGCRLYIKMADLEIHGKECPFSEMLCPLAAIFGQCQWRGKLPQISKHFNDVHPSHCNADVDTEMFLTRCETQMVHYVALGTFNFLFHVKVSECDRKIYMTAQLIGTKQSASKWSYEIHIYNKSQARRKYQYVDVCHSNKTPLSEIFAEEKCAILPFSYAENFFNRDCINYKFFIKKDFGSKSSRSRSAPRRRC